MPKPIRFSDPIFTCEVELDGLSAALYSAVQLDFDRLKTIRNLGIISHLTDSAIYTRHHHLIGLLSIFEKLLNQPSGRGLPSRFIWSFWARVCYAQAGHAVFAYDAEKAILLASIISEHFRQKLHEFLAPAISSVRPCETCTIKEACASHNHEDAAQWLDKMFKEYEWRRLHFWVAARKLANNDVANKILASIKPNTPEENGFAENEMYKILLSPHCKWDKIANNLNRLDYVLRDLFLTGRFNFQFDSETLIASVDKDYSDWSLLEQLDDYLNETLYSEKKIQTIRALFIRSVADFLVSGKLSLEQLFGEDGNVFSDDDLQRILSKRKKWRGIFLPREQEFWNTWVISHFPKRPATPYALTEEIVGSGKTFLTFPFTHGFMVHKLYKPHEMGLSIRYESRTIRPEYSELLKTVERWLRQESLNVNVSDTVSALWSITTERDVKFGTTGAAERLAKISNDEDCFEMIKAAYRSMRDKTKAGDNAFQGIAFSIGGAVVPIERNPVRFSSSLMYAAMNISDPDQGIIGLSRAGILEYFWRDFLDWQFLFDRANKTQEIRRLVEYMQQKLMKEITSRGAMAAKDLEILALLDAIDTPTKGVKFSIAVPNLILLDTNKVPAAEFDAVSIVLKRAKKVEIWIWGCTTGGDIGKKRRADNIQIQKFKDIISTRWGDSIRTVSNYYFLNGDKISKEIDGVVHEIGADV